MREADYPSHAPLGDTLAPWPEADQTLRSLTRRFAPRGSNVAVPANASNRLVDAVKAAGCLAMFATVAVDGSLAVPAGASAIWLQTVAGHPPTITDTDVPVLLDASDTAAPPPGTVLPGGSAGLAVGPALPAVTHRAHRAGFDRVREGLAAAAGLPVWPHAAGAPEPLAVVVQLPAEVDALTFVAYARGENVSVGWWPELRPIHPLARTQLTVDQLHQTRQALSRLVLVPIGPQLSEEEQDHAVLGIVKAAEYTGWRWVTDPARAAWYCHWLADSYGPEHDAYRPAFSL